MVRFPPISAADLQKLVSGTVWRGGGDHFVSELGEPSEVGPNGAAFIFSRSYLKYLARTKASVLVIQSAFAEQVADEISDAVKLCIVCPNAYLGLANFTRKIAETDPLSDWHVGAAAAGVNPSAHIDPTAKIGPGALIGAGAAIGPSSIVLGNAVIGPEVRIGRDCMIFPGAVLYPRTVVGDRVRIHANAVVGCDGFGYAPTPTGSVKIWHLGGVVIGDDVEIGAGTTIDRGTINDTVIETGAKIDNLVQIGHNGHIMAHAILCAQVGLSGNVTVGRGAILAGKVGVANKLKIGDGAVIGSMSGLAKDVAPGAQLMGQQSAKPRREWWRLVSLFERLPELFDRVKKLEGASE